MDRHRFDLLSFIAGIVFVIVGAAHLTGFDVTSAWVALVRAWPVLLLVAGVAVLAGAVRTTDDT